MVKRVTRMVSKKKIIDLKRIIRRRKGIEDWRRAMTTIEAGKVKYLRGIRKKKCNKSRTRRGKERNEKKNEREEVLKNGTLEIKEKRERCCKEYEMQKRKHQKIEDLPEKSEN